MLCECANPHCFYCGTLLGVGDVVWREVWDSFLHDLTPVAYCPSCNEPMMYWDEPDKVAIPNERNDDGTIQTTFVFPKT